MRNSLKLKRMFYSVVKVVENGQICNNIRTEDLLIMWYSYLAVCITEICCFDRLITDCNYNKKLN